IVKEVIAMQKEHRNRWIHIRGAATTWLVLILQLLNDLPNPLGFFRCHATEVVHHARHRRLRHVGQIGDLGQRGGFVVFTHGLYLSREVWKAWQILSTS